jgi:hypothetical protein
MLVLNCSRPNVRSVQERQLRSEFPSRQSPALTTNKMFTKSFGVLGGTMATSRDPPFVPEGSAMQILVPWKPVVLV